MQPVHRQPGPYHAEVTAIYAVCGSLDELCICEVLFARVLCLPGPWLH